MVHSRGEGLGGTLSSAALPGKGPVLPSAHADRVRRRHGSGRGAQVLTERPGLAQLEVAEKLRRRFGWKSEGSHLPSRSEMTPLLVTAPARIRPSRGIVATSRCHWFVLGSYMSTDFSLSHSHFNRIRAICRGKGKKPQC